MITAFRTLTPDEPLSTAMELVQHGSQHDFPVTRDGHVAGMLTRHDMLRGLTEGGPQSRVADAMNATSRSSTRTRCSIPHSAGSRGPILHRTGRAGRPADRPAHAEAWLNSQPPGRPESRAC